MFQSLTVALNPSSRQGEQWGGVWGLRIGWERRGEREGRVKFDTRSTMRTQRTSKICKNSGLENRRYGGENCPKLKNRRKQRDKGGQLKRVGPGPS